MMEGRLILQKEIQPNKNFIPELLVDSDYLNFFVPTRDETVKEKIIILLENVCEFGNTPVENDVIAIGDFKGLEECVEGIIKLNRQEVVVHLELREELERNFKKFIYLLNSKLKELEPQQQIKESENLLRNFKIYKLKSKTHPEMLYEYLRDSRNPDFFAINKEFILEKMIRSCDEEGVKVILDSIKSNNESLKNKNYFHIIINTYLYLPENSTKLKNIILNFANFYSPSTLKNILNHRPNDYSNLNPLEYASKHLASNIFNLFCDLNNGIVTRESNHTLHYDVSNFIPDTMLGLEKLPEEAIEMNESGNKEDIIGSSLVPLMPSSGISYLEWVISSCVLRPKGAIKIIQGVPMRFLVYDYVMWGKMCGWILFILQVVFMSVFTHFTINNFNLFMNENDKKFQIHVGLGVLWILWPFLSFLFSLIQFVGIIKLWKKCDEGIYLEKLKNFPWLNLTFFICFFFWFLIISCNLMKKDYFEIVCCIFILGWLIPVFHLSFTSFWSAFYVALKSSLLKYILSFIFYFLFIITGFTLAFFTLRTKYMKENSFEDTFYISFVTLFGMGELDSVPGSMESTDKIVFFKLIICLYCSIIAILVLAVIRQPDEEVFERVGSELTSRINLQLIKNVAWLLLLRKKFNRRYLQPDIYGSFMYEMKSFLGILHRDYRFEEGRYVLRVSQSEYESCKQEVEEECDDLIEKVKQVSEKLDNLENLLKAQNQNFIQNKID